MRDYSLRDDSTWLAWETGNKRLKDKISLSELALSKLAKKKYIK